MVTPKTRADLFSSANHMTVKKTHKLTDEQWQFLLMDATRDMEQPIEKLRVETQKLMRQHSAREE